MILPQGGRLHIQKWLLWNFSIFVLILTSRKPWYILQKRIPSRIKQIWVVQCRGLKTTDAVTHNFIKLSSRLACSWAKHLHRFHLSQTTMWLRQTSNRRGHRLRVDERFRLNPSEEAKSLLKLLTHDTVSLFKLKYWGPLFHRLSRSNHWTITLTLHSPVPSCHLRIMRQYHHLSGEEGKT